MPIGIIFLHVALAIVTFLIMLNGYLRGAAKAKADAVLSVAWVGLIATAMFSYGWRQGLTALVASFIYSRAWIPVARVLAHRMLGYLHVQQVWKYKYEVVSRRSPFFGKVDWVFSRRDLLLRDGHSYHVRLNDDPAYPQVLKVFRELEKSTLAVRGTSA